MAAVTIFAAGCYYDYKSIFLGDLIIAADGGYDFCKNAKILPDVIIGDFDSLSELPDDIKIIKLPTVKDITDTAAAVDYAKDFDEFHIYGGTGSRLDHTLANIALAADISKQGKKVFIYDSGCVITAVTDGAIFFSPPENLPATVSVFSFSDISEGVDEKGLRYPLCKAVLKNNIPLGVSNEFTAEKAKISVAHGTIVVIYDEDAKVIKI
jgi:thiamine pyrophosphokinase